MNRPVPYERLIAYAVGKLPRAEADLVEAFLARNPEAAQTVERFRQTLASLNADDSVAPPTDTLERAKALFAERRVPREAPSLSWIEQLQRTVAALIFDSRPQLALAGFRGGSDEYQLGYETDDVAIDIEVAPATDDDRRTLMGQVSASAESRAECVVLSSPGSFEPITMATPDSSGIFELNSESGVFDLLVAVGDRLIVVPNLEVQ